MAKSWTCQVMESLLKHSGSADEVGVTGEAFALNLCGFPCFFLGWEQKNPTCEYMIYDTDQKLKVQRWRSSLQFTSFVRCICCLPHHNKWSRSFPLLGRSLGSLFGGCSPPLDLVDVGRDFWSSKLEMTFPYGGQSCPPKNCAVLHGSLHKMSKFSLVTSLEMISQVTFGVF